MIVEENPDAPECLYEIKYGESLEITVAPESEGTPVYVKFVPEITSNYILKSEAEGVDTGCFAYNSLLEEVSGEYRDDTEEGYDFRFEGKFEAGSIYYLNILTYSDKTETFSITLECGHIYKNGICIVCGEMHFDPFVFPQFPVFFD